MTIQHNTHRYNTTETLDHGRLIVNREFSEIIKANNLDSAARLWNVRSETVKAVIPERSTGRIWLKSPGTGDLLEFYIKRFVPASMGERLKNWICLKQGWYDAFHEWRAINTLLDLGLDTMLPAAVAQAGANSCLLTLGITDFVRASDLMSELHIHKDRELRRRIICDTACIMAIMHANGIAHQDFYLVHLLIRPAENHRVYIIDLQRMIMNKQLSIRWRIKDLAQILFSSAGIVSEHEISLFWDTYLENAGRNWGQPHRTAQRAVKKAQKMAQRHNRKQGYSKNSPHLKIIPEIPCGIQGI